MALASTELDRGFYQVATLVPHCAGPTLPTHPLWRPGVRKEGDPPTHRHPLWELWKSGPQTRENVEAIAHRRWRRKAPNWPISGSRQTYAHHPAPAVKVSTIWVIVLPKRGANSRPFSSIILGLMRSAVTRVRPNPDPPTHSTEPECGRRGTHPPTLGSECGTRVATW